MNVKPLVWAVSTGVFAGLIPYVIDYYDGHVISHGDGHLIMILGALLGSFILQYFLRLPAFKTALFVYLGAVLTVLALAPIKEMTDSSWLMAIIDIMLLSMMILPAVFLGAYSSKLIQHLRKGDEESTEIPYWPPHRSSYSWRYRQGTSPM